MARGQAARGLEVHVATTDDNGPDRLAAPDSKPLVKESVSYWIFPRQIRFYTFSWQLAKWLLRHVAEFDVIHIHALFSFASVVAAVCAKRRGIPYIVRPLGTLNQWGMHKRRPWLKRLSFRFIESRIIKSAAGVQYTSEQEALEAGQLGVDHSPLIVPNPVDVSASRGKPGGFRAAYPQLTDGAVLVLFLSRLDPKKGLDLLLNAFARVREKHPEATLVIAGDGDPAFVAGLKRCSQRLGLDEGILWPGFLQGREKLDALADADLFILPSYSENFGVAVVETMAAGLPVIVSDQVGIHREISASGAGIVVRCSESELVHALQRMIMNPTLRTEAGQNGQKLAARFSVETVCDQLVTLYQEIISHTPVNTCAYVR
jgi:glycosyltransferase involved in cell wall biosynthesis